MSNITLDGLPLKTGTVSDAGIVHYRESGVDKKLTISDLIAKFLANNPKLSSIEALSSIANLLSLAGLNGSTNKIPYFTGAGAMAIRDLLATTTTQGVAYLSNPITISNNALDANNDIDFSAGNFQFSDGSGQAVATAIMTKRLDATWSAGTNQGGLDTGTKQANTWYHCYAIYNPTTQVSDFIFSANATNPTLPSGFTKYKYLGSVLTNVSANIIAFTQNNNEFKWSVPFSESFDALITTSNKTLTLTVPPVLLKPNVSCYWQGGSVGSRVERLDFTSNLTGVYYMQAITFGNGTAFPHYFNTVINTMIINDKNILYKATVGGASGTGFCYTNGYQNLSL